VIKLLQKIKKETGNLSYVASGGAWILFGKGASMLASVGIMLVFANFIPKEVYGSYKYILSFFGIASLAALPGVNTVLSRAVAKGKEGVLFLAEKEKLKWSILGVLFLLGVAVYYFVKGNMVLGSGFLVAGLFLPVRRISELFPFVWQGRKDFKTQNILEAVGYVIPAIALTATLLLTENLVYILLAFFGSYSFVRGLIYLRTRRTITKNEVDQDTISFGKHLTLIQALLQAVNQLDKIILWHFAGPISVATLAFAQMPIGQLKALIPIQQLALPKLSNRKPQEFRELLLPKFKIMILVLVPVTTAIILLAPFVFGLLFPVYSASVPLFQVLCLGLLLMPFTLLNTSLITELRKKELYITRTISPLVKLVLYITLTPVLGVWGIVYAILAGQVVDAVLVYYFFMKITENE
jgi:O-antigen/teichoic acid export membrane protein